MEMPINIIVVLFVVIVVGGAIVYFAQHSLNTSQQQLNEQWRKDPSNKDYVVELQAASDADILNLAHECVKKGRGNPDSQLCFAVFASSFPDFSLMDGQDLGDSFTLNTSGVSGSQNAVRITYNPVGQIVVND